MWSDLASHSVKKGDDARQTAAEGDPYHARQSHTEGSEEHVKRQ